jgi:lipopolysaccharide export LptBFGC system permease protein LptF
MGSVGVFASFLVLLTGGERLADRGAMSPALAMWGANALGLTLAALLARVGNARRASARGAPTEGPLVR